METSVVLIALILTPSRLLSHRKFIEIHRALQAWWTRSLVAAIQYLFNLNVEVTGRDAPRCKPGIMLVRHSSLLDTLLPALLLSDSGIGFRYVLKHALLLDPCLDLVGCRLPNTFVQRHGDTQNELAAIQHLARTTPHTETVVIYPEGTRYTADRRLELLQKLRMKESQRLPIAESLRHTLPPRSGGTLALLEHLDSRPVVVMAHVGLEEATHVTDIFRGNLVGRKIAIRMWIIRPDDIPHNPTARREWLDSWWLCVDEWIEQHLPSSHSKPSPSSPPMAAQ